MSVSIRIDTSSAVANLDALAQTQIPFALAKAITQTGLDFQQAERRHFAEVFTERQRSFLELQGVKLIGGIATKTKPSITFGIDPKASFLAKFEAGDPKAPRGSFLALPTDARYNKRDIISAANRPRALLNRLGRQSGSGGVFKLDVARGRLVPGIYQRTGKGGRNVKLLFAFERQAQTPRSLDFVEIFQKTVTERWQQNFQTALADAIRTAK